MNQTAFVRYSPSSPHVGLYDKEVSAAHHRSVSARAGKASPVAATVRKGRKSLPLWNLLVTQAVDLLQSVVDQPLVVFL